MATFRLLDKHYLFNLKRDLQKSADVCRQTLNDTSECEEMYGVSDVCLKFLETCLYIVKVVLSRDGKNAQQVLHGNVVEDLNAATEKAQEQFMVVKQCAFTFYGDCFEGRMVVSVFKRYCRMTKKATRLIVDFASCALRTLSCSFEEDFLSVKERTGNVSCAAAGPSQFEMACGLRDGSVRVWVTSKGYIQLMPFSDTAVADICYTPDFNSVVCMAQDRTVIVVDVRTGRRLRTF